MLPLDDPRPGLHWEITMRKVVFAALALGAFGFLVVEPVSAGRIGLNGTYTRLQLKELCDKNGGTYGEGPGGYSCGKQCAGNEWCIVGCKNPSSCYGECPKCTARIRGGFGRNAGVGKILGSFKPNR
jgi:hypothetical protein